jgi:HK97 gp10 family phage protein
MATRLDFDGLDGLAKDLNKMDELLKSSIIDDALKESIQPAYQDAKKNAPRNKKGHIGRYGSGHMADNIPLKLVRDGKSRTIEYGWEKSDNSNYYYAKFVEWGTSNDKYPKHPFLNKSMSKNKTKCFETFSEIIRKKLGL